MLTSSLLLMVTAFSSTALDVGARVVVTNDGADYAMRAWLHARGIIGPAARNWISSNSHWTHAVGEVAGNGRPINDPATHVPCYLIKFQRANVPPACAERCFNQGQTAKVAAIPCTDVRLIQRRNQMLMTDPQQFFVDEQATLERANAKRRKIESGATSTDDALVNHEDDETVTLPLIYLHTAMASKPHGQAWVGRTVEIFNDRQLTDDALEQKLESMGVPKRDAERWISYGKYGIITHAARQLDPETLKSTGFRYTVKMIARPNGPAILNSKGKPVKMKFPQSEVKLVK